MVYIVGGCYSGHIYVHGVVGMQLKLEQDAATGMQSCTWAEHGSHSAQVQVAYLLLHPAPTCAVRLAPTLYLHS